MLGSHSWEPPRTADCGPSTHVPARNGSVAFGYDVKAVPTTYEASDGRQHVAVNVSTGATDRPRRAGRACMAPLDA